MITIRQARKLRKLDRELAENARQAAHLKKERDRIRDTIRDELDGDGTNVGDVFIKATPYWTAETFSLANYRQHHTITDEMQKYMGERKRAYRWTVK